MLLNGSSIDQYIKDYSSPEDALDALFSFVAEKYKSEHENTLSDREFSCIVPEDFEDDVIEKMAASEKWFRMNDYFGVEKKYLSK